MIRNPGMAFVSQPGGLAPPARQLLRQQLALSMAPMGKRSSTGVPEPSALTRQRGPAQLLTLAWRRRKAG